MKNLFIYTAGFLLLSMSSFAQPAFREPGKNQPRLFKSQPDKIPVNTGILNSLFGFHVGQKVNVHLSATTNFLFEGNIIAAVSKYENTIQSVVVSSALYPGANFTISKIVTDNGSVIYRGRMMSLHAGDMYELQNQGGTYFLVKRDLNDMLNE